VATVALGWTWSRSASPTAQRWVRRDGPAVLTLALFAAPPHRCLVKS
jgi:hypothetical protein